MSRYPEYQKMSAVITAAVRAAWQDNRAKNVARALGCSVITGKRIAATGKMSAGFRQKLIDILDRRIAQNRAEMERLQSQLKAIEHEEMVARAAHRRAQALGATIEGASGLAERSEDALPLTGGEG